MEAKNNWILTPFVSIIQENVEKLKKYMDQ